MNLRWRLGLWRQRRAASFPISPTHPMTPAINYSLLNLRWGMIICFQGGITCVSMKPADPQKLKAPNHKFLQQKLVSRGLSIWRARGITGKDSLRPPYSRPNLTLFPGIFNDQKRKPLSWHLMPSALWVKYPAVLRPNSQTPIILPSPDTHIFYFLSFIPLHHSFCAWLSEETSSPFLSDCTAGRLCCIDASRFLLCIRRCSH